MERDGIGVAGAEGLACDVDNTAVRLRLLALPHHACEECASPRSARLLRSLGRSKVAGARRVLQRESTKLLAVLRRRAIVIDLDDVARAAQELPMRDDLAGDTLKIIRAYEDAAEVAQRCGDTALAVWLAQYARLHGEQHRLLDEEGRAPGRAPESRKLQLRQTSRSRCTTGVR